MSANICNICGANLIYKDGKWVCPACGAYKTEEISNEEVTLLYNAAQKLRLASFDDAEEAYRDIIAKYPENSEGHWGLVLSKYGIKYEDDYDGKKLPTCYATSIESILADKDYLDAVRLCKDKYQKEYYIEQGKVLEKIHIEWLEKASKEPKYDVFLCFKDSDKQNNMERTDDSIEVANLYTHLSSLGYKVFYSRESLRDKVAEKYEPYIYNALNTAAVMIVYGSKIEYFSSVWMKNEWTRYVRRLREGLKIDGSLVIACDGVNPAELPRPLNQMQVLDARKKTFYGDLETHIAKIISIARRPKVTVERVEITGAIGKKKASVDNQIKTIKVGGNVSKKTPVVIDNAVSVREIGRFDVPELSPDEDTKLKSVNSYIKNELFDNAKKVVDEILEKNKYNGQALLADLLITYKVKSIDELTEKLDEIEDFSQFNTVIEYNDKEIGEKLIAVIGQKIRLAIANSNYDVAIAALKEIVVYNSAEVLNIRLELRNTAKRLLSVSSKTAAEIFDVLLNSYRDGDTYIEYIQGFVGDCLATGNFTIAQKYNDKIIELDDGNLKATFAAAFISVRAKNAIEFVDSADKFIDFKIFDDAIKHFDEDEIKSCFDSLQNVIDGLIKSQKSGEVIADWFDFVVKYEFDGRTEFIEKTINELAELKDLASRAKLFDKVILCIDGSDVERHISMRLDFAKKLQMAGSFNLAEKYYKQVIDIEEGNLDALWGVLLCKLKANRDADLADVVEQFTDFPYFENLLKYCPNMNDRTEYLNKLTSAVVMSSASSNKKNNIEKLSKVFDGLIKYYPEELNTVLVAHLQKFADNCKTCSAFSLAEKYYAMILSIDNMKHEAYWGLLQAKLNCRNNDDLIKQDKIITEFSEFSSAIAASCDDERSSERYCKIAKNQLDYIEKQKELAKQKKKRKSLIKKLTAMVAVVVAVVIGVFAFVGYRKSESVLKYSPNATGVSVYAGKYYNAQSVEIPAVYNGKPVTEISNGAFNGLSDIKKIVLPDSITKIGDNAFNGATSLEVINIPDNVTSIGKYAFAGCKNLKTIVIPEKTIEVFEGAFSGCENLTEITIVAREGDINGFAEDWKAGLPSSTKIKIGFVINLDYNGATSGVDTNKPVVGVNENYTLPAPARNGYKFLGWYDALTNGNKLTDENGRSVSVYQQEESITVYARWEANLNSIVFDANGGNGTMQNQQIATDSSTNLSECAFTKVGYTFIGWGTTSTQKTYDDKAEYAMGANSTYRLYAIWQANVNTLRFNANGGDGAMSDMNIKTDETKTLTACGFSRKGYDFAGWATSENGTKAYGDKSNYLMGSDSGYTLYALWTPTKYTITYNLNGGGVSNANKTEYTIESETFTLINPTRPGYAFNGWTSSNLSDKTYTVSISTGSTGNLSFTANYDANLNSLLFNANGGVGETPEMLIETDKTVKLNACAFSRKGYDFVGWATSQNGEKVYSNGQNYTMGVNSEYVLYAVWKIKTYTIEYNLNNGTAPSNKTSYTVETESFMLENPSRDGYTFIGWSGTDIADKSSAVTIEKGSIGNKSFTANWQANTNVLHFNANGGDGNMDDMSIKTDETKTLTANTFTRKGYKFNGWSNTTNGALAYLDSSSYKMGTSPVYTLYAIWEANTNRLIFNGNGATSGGMDEMSIKTDESTILTDCGFAKIGYSFKGWATESNGSVKYSNKATYTMGTESSYTLYAVWQINQYTITLELNGGTASKNSITQDYNTVVEPLITTRPGYNFVEWYIDSNFATVYNFSTMPAENVTVYAKWQMKTSGDELTGIRNYDEFKEIKNHLNGNFYLEKDIVLDSTWQTIESFSGKLDGRSKNITYINNQGVNGNGSLICVNNGTITNLNIIITIKNTFNESKNYGFVAETNHGSITSINISGKLDVNLSVNTKFSEDYYYFGTVCGLDDGTLSDINCSVEFNLSSVNSYEYNLGWVYSSYNYNLCIGGIVGKTSYLKNCQVNNNIDAKSYSSWENNRCDLPIVVGGVAGEMAGCQSCSFKGSIKEYRALYCGGIAGKKISGGNITKSYSIVNYNTNWRAYYLGGLVGMCIDNTIDECYAINNYNMRNSEYTVCLNVGGLIGFGNANLTIKNSFVINLNADKTRENIGEYQYGSNSFVENSKALSTLPNDYYEIVNNIGWDLSKWVIGYDSPLFLDDMYITVSYKNIENASTNKNPSAYKKNSEGFDLTSISKDGYTFDGWYSDSSYTTKVEKVVNITKPLTLYAKWTPNNYTVTLNTVGGEVLKNTATVTYDSDYTLEVPTRLGYTFLGWYDGTGNSAVAYTDETGKSLNNWSILNNDTILYAHWETSLNVLRFDPNGGAGTMSDKKVKTNETCVLSPCSFTRDGYIFAGWATSIDGHKEYSDGSIYTMGIYPINILYAVWNENDIKVELRFESDAYTVVGIKSGLSGTYEIVIPEYYDGYPVTKIEDNAFYNNNSITAITITKNIIVVGDKAFYDCDKLKTITITNVKLQSLGNECFAGCFNLGIVYFSGEKDEWISIKKGEKWDIDCGHNNYNSGYWLNYSGDSEFIDHNYYKDHPDEKPDYSY